jgi:hypothetical protein
VEIYEQSEHRQAEIQGGKRLNSAKLIQGMLDHAVGLEGKEWILRLFLQML